MSDRKKLNDRGNIEGAFSQGVGGWAEYTVNMTKTTDTVRHDIQVPPGKVIPVIFLPGVMGSNLRMSKMRQNELSRPDNRAWRPDDLVDKSGKAGIVTGNGMGGWLKNATPRERQLIFDPNETEVEYYYYTENKGRFDPDGKETFEADARHQNVPDDFDPIPPLIASRIGSPPDRNSNRAIPTKGIETPAQIARWRGWSEVLFSGAYGDILKNSEHYLNNMLKNEEINAIWRDVCADPASFGAAGAAAITESDIKKIAPCWYPVHAMGYNFMVSNAKSAKVIAERIRHLVKGYQGRGFKCDEVIIITHSMGGLVGRALLHPSYGNLLNDNSVKVLGMYHNVMPTLGAASAYKRMRFGFQEGWGYISSLEAKVLAIDGRHATAILANTPAPLEMLPGPAYGKDWLKVVDATGKTLWSWPRGNGTALDSIYLQPASAWWRLVNPNWVNPANVPEKKGGGLLNVYKRLEEAFKFLHSIEQTFHPTNCYARLTVQAGERKFALYLQKPSAAGDQTVPSQRSAQHIKGTIFTHGREKGNGYEHQSSYSNPKVLISMLYSVVQIAKTARWD
jgi:hypothetical protein